MFCPKKKGYFPFMLTKIQESLAEEDKAKFASLNTKEERIEFVLALPRLSSRYEDNLFKIIRPYHGDKSRQKSEENRESGNSAFHAGNFRQAQILYSIAVFTAPVDVEDDCCFALALANRSACLQRLGSHHLAMEDIDLALQSGYPEGKAFKLLERKAECLQAMGRLEDAEVTYRMAFESLKDSNLPRDKKDKARQGLTKRIHLIHEAVVQQQPQPNGQPFEDHGSQDHLICDVLQPSDHHPAAHRGVEVRYGPRCGRHAVAAEDIPIGTTIIHERPITFALYSEKFGSNCQHCFGVIRAVIPCPTCAWVCFCSRRCRDLALQSYHKYECPILKLLVESGLNVYSSLSLRAVCKEGLALLVQQREKVDNRNEAGGITQAAGDSPMDGAYSSDGFANLINLCAQEHLLDSDEWFLRTFIACFLLKMLMITSFFDDSADPERDQIFVGKILLQLLNICPFNSHDISEIESPVADQFAASCNKVSLGAGIYPTLALFNHSCAPDFMRCNRGNGVVCIANRYIRKGEEICENYGLMYTMKVVEERKSVLKDHYKFDCYCLACVEDWPTLTQMKGEYKVDPDDKHRTRFKKFRCVHCGARLSEGSHSHHYGGARTKTCLVCGKNTNIFDDIPLQQIKDASRGAVQRLLTGRWDEGIRMATECHDLVVRHLAFPVLEMTEVQIAIWKCMWLKIGNLKLVKYL